MHKFPKTRLAFDDSRAVVRFPDSAAASKALRARFACKATRASMDDAFDVKAMFCRVILLSASSKMKESVAETMPEALQLQIK